MPEKTLGLTLFTEKLHWVCGIEPHRIALTSCPPNRNTLPSLIIGWKAAGVDLVVSLIEPDEEKLFGVEDEAAHCIEAGIAFKSFPIPDHSVPTSPVEFRTLIDELSSEVRNSQALVIHCYAGIGRTGIVAACLLHALKIPSNSIYDILAESRGWKMPESKLQRQWIEAFNRNRANEL